MNKPNNVKYYKDITNAGWKEELKYIIVYENCHVNDNNIKWLEGYNILDGHFELKDVEYLSNCCKEITKKQYIDFTKGYYIPEVYL